MATLPLPPRSTPLFLKPAERSGLGAPRRELSADEVEEVRFAFDCLDYEKAGTVSQKQLKVALRAMGFPCKKADVVQLLQKWGEEDSERLDFSSFARAVAEKMQERSPQDDLKRAFRLFDIHGQGKIDIPTLRKVCKSLEVDVGEDELHAMVAEFDVDKDGMISEAEFLSIMATADDTL